MTTDPNEPDGGLPDESAYGPGPVDHSGDWADPPPDDSPTYGVQPDQEGPSVAEAFAASVARAKAAGVGGGGGDPTDPPGGPAEGGGGMGWEDVLAGLADAADRLSKAADELSGAAGGGGKSDRDDQSPSPGGGANPVDGWAKGVLGRASGRFSQTVGKWFGGEAGNLAGAGGNKLVSGLFGGAGAGAAGGAGAAAGGAGAGAAGGAGMLAAAGPVGIGLAAVVTAAEALKKFHDAVVEATNAQHQQNMKYAEFSAAMARVDIREQMDQWRRNREIGDATANTAGWLQASKSGYDDTAAEFEKLGSNLKNAGLSILIEALNQALRPFIPIAQRVNDWFDRQEGKEFSGDITEFVKKAQDDIQAKRQPGDDWFNRPDRAF